MDAIKTPVMGGESMSVRSPEQLSFAWTEQPVDLTVPSMNAPAPVAPGLTRSDELIEFQTRVVKSVFFTLLGLALVAVHYFDR